MTRLARHAAALFGLWAAAALAAGPPPPGPMDTCPVCGMLVSKYPNWVATIVYNDGHAHHFDGAKDMFKFWFAPGKYAKEHRRQDIATLWVTDYYNLRPIDARKAFFVVGSDVLGPMGNEFVPLASRGDAEEFFDEHHGHHIYRFDEVTEGMPAQLDAGRF